MNLDIELSQYVERFWSVRRFAGDVDNPITPAIIAQWQAHNGGALAKWERECLFSMDRTLRQAHSDVLSFHANRPQVKNKEDKDKKRKWRT